MLAAAPGLNATITRVVSAAACALPIRPAARAAKQKPKVFGARVSFLVILFLRKIAYRYSPQLYDRVRWALHCVSFHLQQI
jgi:hypothetical protein